MANEYMTVDPTLEEERRKRLRAMTGVDVSPQPAVNQNPVAPETSNNIGALARQALHDTSMAAFTPREEVAGTFGTRIGGNGEGTPMNTLEDVNKNVASFKAPKDFTAEVIQGNQRSLVGFDKTGTAVPLANNPFEASNKEARKNELFNMARSALAGQDLEAQSETTRTDKKGNVDTSTASHFGNTRGNALMGAYNAAVGQDTKADIADARMSNAIELMKMRGQNSRDLALLKAVNGPEARHTLDKNLETVNKSYTTLDDLIAETIKKDTTKYHGEGDAAGARNTFSTNRQRADYVRQVLPQWLQEDRNRVLKGDKPIGVDLLTEYMKTGKDVRLQSQPITEPKKNRKPLSSFGS